MNWHEIIVFDLILTMVLFFLLDDIFIFVLILFL